MPRKSRARTSSFIHRLVDFLTKSGPQNFALDLPSSMIGASMTKKEAIRRLENLALERGHKRNYYVKRALVEFLDRKVHLLGYRRTHVNGVPTLDEISRRLLVSALSMLTASHPRENAFPPLQYSAEEKVQIVIAGLRWRGQRG